MMRLLSLLFGAFLAGTVVSAQSNKVSGQLVVTYDKNKQVHPIAIQSTDEEISTTAKRAFRLHGGFKMVPANQASHTLRLVKRGASAVLLTILRSDGGSPESFPVQGRDLYQAVLVACDMAVDRITGRPGFFAGKLVFVTHSGKIRELYTSDLFFKGFQKLTSHRYQVVSPDWSPDGSRVLYSSNHKGGLDVYMLDVATRVSTPVARYRGQNLGAVFAPHGRRAAMILNREVFINSSILNPNSKPERLTHNKSAETSPTWSPNGRQLIVSSDVRGGAQLYEVILTGRDRGRLKTIRTNVSRECTEPCWNPADSGKIAFTANVGGHSQIAVYDFKEGKTEVFGSSTNDEGASWANDGRHLVYSSQQGGKNQLRILDTFTKKHVPLHTRTTGNFSSPDFVYPRLKR